MDFRVETVDSFNILSQTDSYCNYLVDVRRWRVLVVPVVKENDANLIRNLI